MFFIPDSTRCDRGMMAEISSVLGHEQRGTIVDTPDLLAHQSRQTSLVLPLGQEHLAKEGIDGLLDALRLSPPSVLLISQTRKKPFKYQERSLHWVTGGCGSHKHRRSFSPEGGQLYGRLSVKHKRWSGDIGQIAPDGGDGLFEH
jgi:hypothetical protein